MSYKALLSSILYRNQSEKQIGLIKVVLFLNYDYIFKLGD